MKRIAVLVAGLMTVGLLASAADAQVARGRVRLPSGAAAGGQVHHRVGPNGGTITGARGAARDGQGNAVAGGANCAQGAGGVACRAGKTTRTADGTVTHKSGVAAEGANGGEFNSTGGFTKSADGDVTQSRSTSASTSKGSVHVDSTYNSETGRTRTATCTNTAGEVVACPSR